MYQHIDCIEKTKKIHATTAAAAGEGPELLAEDKASPKQVLIVDDERPIRVLLKKILEANGYV